jgi:hypothetical protein
VSLELGTARLASKMHPSDSDGDSENTPRPFSAVGTAFRPKSQQKIDYHEWSNNGEDSDCTGAHRSARLKSRGPPSV